MIADVNPPFLGQPCACRESRQDRLALRVLPSGVVTVERIAPLLDCFGLFELNPREG